MAFLTQRNRENEEKKPTLLGWAGIRRRSGRRTGGKFRDDGFYLIAPKFGDAVLPPIGNGLLTHPEVTQRSLSGAAPMPRNDLVDFVHIRSLPDWTKEVKSIRPVAPENGAMDSFGKRLKLASKAMGMTLKQLADKSGCSKQLLSSIELGDTEEVKAALLFNIADALQAAPRWLVFGIGTQRLAGALTDQERDLIYILRVLPPALQDHLLQVAEGLAVSTKVVSPVTPFTVPAPKKPR